MGTFPAIPRTEYGIAVTILCVLKYRAVRIGAVGGHVARPGVCESGAESAETSTRDTSLTLGYPTVIL